MMNKKRSHGISRTKYLVFIPLAAFLMLLSNIEAVARITGKIATEALAGDPVKVTGQVIDDLNGPVIGANVLIKGTNTGTITDRNGNFTLEAAQDAVLVFSFPAMKSKEVAVKDVLGNLKVQLYSDGTMGRSQTQSAASQPSVKTSQVVSSPVFTVVEKMPEFPGGQAALLKYLASDVKYPKIAMENGIHGRVVASFVVEKDGSIRDVEIVKGVDPSLDQEAIRVLALMPNWIPGQQRGQNVAVKYTVPVTFSLTGEPESERTPQPTSDQVFVMVEKMPEFPCGLQAILDFIAKTLQYPQIAKENGIEGRVVCSFIVEKDGSLSDINIVRGVDPSLDKEALRIIGEMPKWNPGTQRGKAVKVKYTVPINFSLQ